MQKCVCVCMCVLAYNDTFQHIKIIFFSIISKYYVHSEDLLYQLMNYV